SVMGSRPQARACKACARPISPPSAVTAALLDMFCGLKGATRRPRIPAARQRPATISDLPTFEPAPRTTRAFNSEGPPGGAAARQASGDLPSTFHPWLGLDASPKRMFYQRHFRHQICNLDQLALRVPPREDNMGERRLFLSEKGNDLRHVQVVVAQRYVDFIEQYHRNLRVPNHLLRLLPGRARSGDVAGAILRLPGKPFSHRVKLTEVREMRLDQAALAGIPGTLDELHDRRGHVMGDAAHDHTES